MGRTYQFECAKCGYRVEVAGGSECGQHLAVQTIHCLDCRELHDAVTALKVPDTSATNLANWKIKPTPFDTGPSKAPPPTFALALNQMVVGRSEHFCWVRYQLVCPVTTQHRVRAWKQPGKCPKCGVFLDGSGTPFKVWD